MENNTTAATDSRASLADRYKHIKGWGIDADPENEPTYPMKHYTGDDHKRIHYERPPQQPATVEILHSNERPNITAVFGTSTPPLGLSGRIRRYAFNYSEGSFGHWIPLILADRVNAIEGIIDDLKKGHVPNIFAERGWQAELKYNRKGFALKVLTGIAVVSAIVLLARSKRRLQED
jgi:hypothetical protein